MVVVAHEDDDILFTSPDILHDVAGGATVRVVYITAGDNGELSSYWMSRESGAMAAWADMAGVSNSWTQSDAGIAGHASPLQTLNGAPNISLIFLRLPDGNTDGSGFASQGNTSIAHLWTGAISTITTVDGASSYSKAQLISVLTGLMTSLRPAIIRTQDWIGDFSTGYGDGDHSDHHYAGAYAFTAHQSYTAPHQIYAYMSYTIAPLASNVGTPDSTNKQAVYAVYAPFDSAVTTTTYTYAYTRQYQRGWSQRQTTLPVQQVSGNASSNAVTISITASTAGNTLVAAGRCFTSGSTAMYPASVTDSAGNTWQFSSTAASSPPSADLEPGSHSGCFVAWCVAAASATSVTITFPAGGAYTECNVSEWAGITGVRSAGVTLNTAAAEVTAPALSAQAGDLAVGIAYPASGANPIGGDGVAAITWYQPAGTDIITLLGSDALNWVAYQTPYQAGTLSWDWGAATASAQAAVVFVVPQPAPAVQYPAFAYQMRSTG